MGEQFQYLLAGGADGIATLRLTPDGSLVSTASTTLALHGSIAWLYSHGTAVFAMHPEPAPPGGAARRRPAADPGDGRRGVGVGPNHRGAAAVELPALRPHALPATASSTTPGGGCSVQLS